MKRAVLLLNGSPYTGDIRADGAYVVCCDGAFAWAKDKVRIDENIGDFDSLPYIPEPKPEKIYPSEKDYTDGEIAMRKLVGAGYDEIYIYGGSGGREDHFLGNLQLLYYACNAGVYAEMIDEKTRIFVSGGEITLKNLTGKTVSVFPFGGELHIISSEGFKYPYPQKIGYGVCIGLSNIVLKDEAVISLHKGCKALVIINNGKV